MSESGKPIYSRYGEEEAVSSFFATVSAVIHKVQSYYVLVAEREQVNQLKRVSCNGFDCTFVKKMNLIYMCLVNTRVAEDGEEFIDEKYHKQQLNTLYGSSMSKSGSSSQNSQHHHPNNFQITQKRKVKESSTFIRRQIEYLHLQFISLVTSNVNAQLTKKPNLDIKTSIAGLERTMDMMCDISQISPSIFLQAFQPLRMPDQTRKLIEKCVESNLPKTFACGMLVSSMNPISIFTDPEQVADLKPEDIQVLMNYVYANPSMKNGGETWTPICIPGISEQFILHVYTKYFTINFGIIIVCTDPNTFYECKE